MSGVTDEELQALTGADLGFFPIDDHAATLRADIDVLATKPYLSALQAMAGFVYDVATGEVDDIVHWSRRRLRKDLPRLRRYVGVRRPSRSTSRLIVPTEPLFPWLAASALAAAAYMIGLATGMAPGDTRWVVLTVACCSIITATVLVWHRSRRQEADVRRSERARPAPEELTNWSTETTLVDAGEGHLPPFGEGMLRYSAAVMDLIDHALEVGSRPGHRHD